MLEPLDELAHHAPVGVRDELQPDRRDPRRGQGCAHRRERPAAERRDPLEDLLHREHLRTREIRDLAPWRERRLQRGDERRDDVLGGDRAGARGGPGRQHHRREPQGEIAHHLPGRAPRADDHRRAQLERGHAARPGAPRPPRAGWRGASTAARGGELRRGRRSARAGALRLARERVRRPPLLLRVVLARAGHPVHEEERGPRPLERARQVAPAATRSASIHSTRGSRPRPAAARRRPHRVARGEERRHERAPDEPGRAGDEDGAFRDMARSCSARRVRAGTRRGRRGRRRMRRPASRVVAQHELLGIRVEVGLAGEVARRRAGGRGGGRA